jgi:membrane associated rhomboid family serine protease
MVIVNWKALDDQPQLRCCLIILVVFMILFNILYVLANNFTSSIIPIDQAFGSLGGLFTGVFVGMIMMTRFRGAAANR